MSQVNHWLGADQATCHHMNQWCSRKLTHICVIRPQSMTILYDKAIQGKSCLENSYQKLEIWVLLKVNTINYTLVDTMTVIWAKLLNFLIAYVHWLSWFSTNYYYQFVSFQFIIARVWQLIHLEEYDDVIKWKYFPRYWPFVRGIQWSPVNSPHKGQWCGGLVLSLICAWIKG